MKILVIRFSSIGDIVLTTPILRSLKQQYPAAEIHFLVKRSFYQVIEDNPHIDQIHTIDGDLNEKIKELKLLPFDYIVDLHRNLRSLRVKRAVCGKVCTFNKLNVRKWLYVNLKWDTMPDKSIVDRYFEGMELLQLKNDGEGLDYFIPESKAIKQDDLPMSHWAGYVACVIGGSYATKKFPVEKWKEVVAGCPYPVILLGGSEDREDGERIIVAHPGKVYNACGKFNLTESADIVRRARVVVTNDTGLMHMAAAFKKKIISLWGNTTPQMGMFPYYGFNNIRQNVSRLSVMVEVEGLSSRPCSKIGYDKCPKGHFKCMQLINSQYVVEQIHAFWQNA